MKRRLLSLCLVLCLVLGMVPVGVSAAESGDITVTAGEETVAAVYLGTLAEWGFDCFRAEVPVKTALTVTNSAMTSGNYSRGNWSGSLLVEFKENPFPLEADEVDAYVLTEEEKTQLSSYAPVTLDDGTWAFLLLKDVETGAAACLFLELTEQETFTVTLTEGDTYTIAATQDSVSPVASSGSFCFTVYPVQGYSMDNAVVKANDTILTAEDDVYTVSNITEDIVVTVEGVEQTIENQKTVTVPAGAEVHVYYQNGYSNGNGNDTEIELVKAVSNGDTVTYYYSVGSSGGTYVAFYEDHISYAGYFNSVDDVVLSWEGETRTPSYRGSYDTSTTFGSRGEDSVYTNVNSNGHLVLNEEFMLRAYRGWQIINTDTENVMIEPEFHYSTSDSGIAITPYNERVESTVTASGTSSNNWVYLTPNGSGITYLEIGFDAVHIVDGYEAGEGGGASAQPSDFTWNASDPDRTALIVVQTDGNAASDITFGIQSPSGGWDYEYDTVYFTEAQGSLTMQPTGDVATVSVSHDKGNSYTTLTGSEGIYTVPIVDGNNIIRITDSSGRTAFQVVRGAQISYTVTNLTTGADTVSVRDTVRIDFAGMHTVCPKISGIYNPGYPNSNRLYYKQNGTWISQSQGYQYNFHSNVWIECTAGNENIELTVGGMDTPNSFGSTIGKLYEAEGVNSSATGSTRRNILPDITIEVAGVTDIPATGVYLDKESVSLGIGGTAMLTATVEPEDATDPLVWTSSDEAVAIVAEGTVTAVAEGEAVITVTAGDHSAACTVTVTNQRTGSFTLTTGMLEEDIYASTCGLDNIIVTGPVPVGDITGDAGPDWSVNVEKGTQETVTLTMTGVCYEAAKAKRYFWVNGQVSSVTMADCENGTYTVEITPEWTEDVATLTLGLGSSSKIVGKTYTITMTRVTSEEDETTYTITFPEDQTGYTIVPTDGSENPVAAGGSYSFKIEAADGYDVSNVTVMTSTEGALTAVDGVYTISDINSDVNVSIDGVAEAAKTYTVIFPEDPEGCTVEILEGKNPVEEGGTMTFQVIIADGYEAADLAVKGNGETLEPADAKENIYVLEKIASDITVTVEGITKQEEVVSGDLNGDGEVKTADAILAYAIANGNVTTTEEQLAAADVNGDGEVKTADAIMIYAFANGKLQSFPDAN